MSPQGVYPTADVCAIGDEISSTSEGRHITLYADNLEHGSGVSYVTKGYPVFFEEAVGIPFKTQDADTGNILIAVDTEGIWCVDVYGGNDGGAEVVVPGDSLYINTTTNLVSKIRDNATQLPFGYALGNVGSGSTERIAVKVHWDPRSHWLEDDERLYFGDAREINMGWDEADFTVLPLTDDTGGVIFGNGTLNIEFFQIFGATVNDYILYDTSLGVLTFINTDCQDAARTVNWAFTIELPDIADGNAVEYHSVNVSGLAPGSLAGFGHWVDIGGAGVFTAGASYLYVHHDGIWSGGDISNALVSWAKWSFLPDSDPAWYSLWEINAADANATPDALFNVNNPIFALGYVAGGVSNVIGSVPFFSTAHGALRGWVAIYDAEFA